MSDNIIQLNEDLIKNNLKDLVRSSVEETLNALLDHEADELVNADKYERSGDRKGYRSGHYERNFSTTSDDVTLKVPKLKGIQFETAIIERYKRRECSVEEALIEMYLAGVSVRRVEDITEALWGSKVSPGTISNLNKKAYEHIEEWRSRPLTEEYPYVYVDGVYLKRSWGGEIQNVAVLVAIGMKSAVPNPNISQLFPWARCRTILEPTACKCCWLFVLVMGRSGCFFQIDCLIDYWLDEVFVVCGDNEGFTCLFQIRQKFFEPCQSLFVEMAFRFIEGPDRRIHGEDCGNGRPLFFPA